MRDERVGGTVRMAGDPGIRGEQGDKSASALSSLEATARLALARGCPFTVGGTPFAASPAVDDTVGNHTTHVVTGSPNYGARQGSTLVGSDSYPRGIHNGRRGVDGALEAVSARCERAPLHIARSVDRSRPGTTSPRTLRGLVAHMVVPS